MISHFFTRPIVMNNRLQKLLCGGQSVETDLNCGLSGATVPFLFLIIEYMLVRVTSCREM